LSNALTQRATLYRKIRHFFDERAVLEVETPLLCSHSVTDPYIDSFQCDDRYLQTSPEYAMKRLLAQGAGAIYQICKAFRREEAGSQHNPEFTMLEWYRVGFDHHQLMDEMSDFLQATIGSATAVKISYQDAFMQHLQINPHTASCDALASTASKAGLKISDTGLIKDSDTWLQLLMSHSIEPHLGFDAPCFIYDYPATQASLSKIRQDTPPVAERFELYIKGVELANGFHELTDATEQKNRFEANRAQRKKEGLADIAIDPYFINALETGLPDCAGVALGLDRLLMIQSKATNIQELISFPWQHC
jgi:elongation factor P--(R)-beta-lysine ligase